MNKIQQHTDVSPFHHVSLPMAWSCFGIPPFATLSRNDWQFLRKTGENSGGEAAAVFPLSAPFSRSFRPQGGISSYLITLLFFHVAQSFRAADYGKSNRRKMTPRSGKINSVGHRPTKITNFVCQAESLKYKQLRPFRASGRRVIHSVGRCPTLNDVGLSALFPSLSILTSFRAADYVKSNRRKMTPRSGKINSVGHRPTKVTNFVCQAESLKYKQLRPFRASGWRVIHSVGRCPTLNDVGLSALFPSLSILTSLVALFPSFPMLTSLVAADYGKSNRRQMTPRSGKINSVGHRPTQLL